MFSLLQTISCVCLVSVFIIEITSLTNENDAKRAEEYIMTSVTIDGIKRSNVCGDGYRIEGALLKSYPYSKGETYLPYEDCYMTFQARRTNYHIRIHIVTLDLNDIHGGMNCLDSLRFYKSAYLIREEKLTSVECGQLTEAENFSIISSTGIVTAHFSTDGGNVNGVGFKVILTAFRSPNKTHPCDFDDDEFPCQNGDCISRFLLFDGVPHCLDGSDEDANWNRMTTNDNSRTMTTKYQHWRGLLIIGFLLIIFIAFTLFMAYFVCRRCIHPPMPLSTNEKRNYATIVNSPLNGLKTAVTTEVITTPHNKTRQHLDDDYNLI